MKRFLYLYIFLLSSMLSASAQGVMSIDSLITMRNDADSAYLSRHYTEAAEGYSSVIKAVPDADTYYNLGNAEYRLKHYALAVLAYQRALHFDPSHKDARYNLTLVRTRLADRFSKPSEMFFFSWLREWVTTRSVAQWVHWGEFWLIFLFVGIGVYRFASPMWMKKAGFFFAFFAAICFILMTVFAIVQRYRFHHNDEAVVMTEEVQLYTSPTTNSKKYRLVHEGTTLCVESSGNKGWYHVILPDGTEGYCVVKGIEFVSQR